MNSKNNCIIIDKINYKDVIIIFSMWYIIITINFLICRSNFDNTPMLTGLLHILFITAGRFLFVSLVIFYFISLYSLSFSELGLKIKKIKIKILSTTILILLFFFLLIIFVNIPLSYESLSNKFSPLIMIKSPSDLVRSFFPLSFVFLIMYIIALAEMFILNKIVFELFNYLLTSYLAVVLSSLFYSILLLQFEPTGILINFITGLITLYLYIKTEKSIMVSSLFLAGFYSCAIIYIYGWNYMFF